MAAQPLGMPMAVMAAPRGPRARGRAALSTGGQWQHLAAAASRSVVAGSSWSKQPHAALPCRQQQRPAPNPCAVCLRRWSPGSIGAQQCETQAVLSRGSSNTVLRRCGAAWQQLCPSPLGSHQQAACRNTVRHGLGQLADPAGSRQQAPSPLGFPFPSTQRQLPDAPPPNPRPPTPPGLPLQEAKKLLEEKFKTGKNRWFFTKLRF
jgi:hypothetical protein